MATKTHKKRSFTETDVNTLLEYVRLEHAGRMAATDIAGFYRTFPELDSLFNSRLPTIARLYPDWIKIERDSNNRDWVVVPGSVGVLGIPKTETQMHKREKIERNEATLDGVGGTQEAVATFGCFLQELPERSLSASSLHLFYDRYPQYKSVLSGRFRELSKRFPEHFAMDSGPGGGKSLFRAANLGIGSPGIDSEVVATIHRNVEVTAQAEIVYRWIRQGYAEGSNKVFVNVEGTTGSPTLITFRFGDSSTTYIVDTVGLATPNFYAQSGFHNLFADSAMMKVCIGADRIGSILGFQIKVEKVWDVMSAATVLSHSSRNEELSFADVLSDYDVQTDSVPRWKIDWTIRPLRTEAITLACNLCGYLAELFSKMWEDAYSRNKLEACLRNSDLTFAKAVDWRDSEAKRVLRAAWNIRAPRASQSREVISLTQSSRAKLSAAKRQESLYGRGLPTNACYHYHIATPGECPNEPSCKFAHELS